MKNKDVMDLLSIMNRDDCNLEDLQIFFEDGYEINFDQNDDAWLWCHNHCLGESSFFEDLILEDVLKYDGKEYKFQYFTYGDD